jgi:hypothetical protein
VNAAGFARRQVTTARNISGGPLTTFLLGGLNYQIEHNLFPSMPRPNLRRVQGLVRDYCAGTGLGYSEESFTGSWHWHGLGAAGEGGYVTESPAAARTIWFTNSRNTLLVLEFLCKVALKTQVDARPIRPGLLSRQRTARPFAPGLRSQRKKCYD